MALPYYLPQPTPFLTPPPNDYYGISGTSLEQFHQIQQQHNINTIAYLQNFQYPPPPGYNFNYRPMPFKPMFPHPTGNFLKHHSHSPDSFSFAHTVPNLIYPMTPVPLRPMPTYPVSHEPVQLSYQAQLKQMAKRMAASDARIEAESKICKEAKSESAKLATINEEKALPDKTQSGDVILISSDDEPPVNNHAIPNSDSKIIVESYESAGPNVSLSDDSVMGHKTWFDKSPTEGPGQKYISKIRALVEGVPKDEKNGIIPPTKEKKIRKKSKAKSLGSPDNQILSATPCKKRKTTSDTSELELKSSPNTSWYPIPPPVVYIGLNGTFVTNLFYSTIPWESYEESTRLLIGHFFNQQTLANTNLDGENSLNFNIIDDIVTHVSEKCHVLKEHVRSIISTMCAEEYRMSLSLQSK